MLPGSLAVTNGASSAPTKPIAKSVISSDVSASAASAADASAAIVSAATVLSTWRYGPAAHASTCTIASESARRTLPKRTSCFSRTHMPDGGDDAGADEAEDDASGRAEVAVLDRPGEEGADAHEDRERGDRESTVATEKLFDIDVPVGRRRVDPFRSSAQRRAQTGRELPAAGDERADGLGAAGGAARAWLRRRSRRRGRRERLRRLRRHGRRGRRSFGDNLRRRRPFRSQLRAQRTDLLVQRAHVLLQHCYSLFVRHRSPLGEAARTTAAARACAPRSAHSIYG